MSNAVSSISNSVNQIGNSGAFNTAKQVYGGMVGGVAGVPGMIAGSNIFKNPAQQPSAPGVDPGVASTLASQQQNAQQFRANLPANEQAAYGNLAIGANSQLTSNLKTQNASDNSRGLLYGGINTGHQQQQRANTSMQLATGRENINDQYQNAANQMDAAAVGTGVAVQQSQQAVQDQIYNQALTNMMQQNQAFGSLLGAGGMAAGMALA